MTDPVRFGPRHPARADAGPATTVKAALRHRRGLAAWAAGAWLFAACLSSAAGADFQAGQTAYDEGDFTAARAAWTEAAVAGDVEAQYALGTILANGTGVPRDVISAYAWFAIAHANGAAGARENFELLLRRHIPRHCHYDALKLVRDFESGQPERLARGGRQRSRCWRIR